MEDMTLLELIEAYGYESALGGQGYTFSDSEPLLDEIKERLEHHAADFGGCSC